MFSLSKLLQTGYCFMLNSHTVSLFLFFFILVSCKPVEKTSTDTPEPNFETNSTITPISTNTSLPVGGATNLPFVSPSHTADEAQAELFQAEETIIFYYDTYSEAPFPSHYLAAEYAARDALNRFPDSSLAETWKWKIPYYSAFSGHAKLSIDTYMDLISDALNKDKISPEDLSSWFQSGELKPSVFTMPFTLKITDFEKGNQYLIELGALDSDEHIQSTCYFVKKTDNVFSIYLIGSSFQENGFHLLSRDSVLCELKDLTNDGVEEIVLNDYQGGHSGISTIQVFDVSSLSPALLPFDEFGEVESVYLQGYSHSEKGGNRIELLLCESRFCDVAFDATFEWNGEYFEKTLRDP